MSRQCVYCGNLKEDDEFTGEHVIPDAIGGTFEQENPFKLTDVCERCNNVFGLYVDAPFIRSFFTQNNRADSALRIVEPGPKTIVPLRYMGRQPSLTYGSKLCDRWLGPTGDSIYHFHEPYPEKENWSIAVGPPPGRRELATVDPGLVFFFLRSNNPAWLPTILLSLKNQFPKSTVFLGNDLPAIASWFPPIPDQLQELYQDVKADCLNGGSHTLLTHEIHSGERFVAKVALGLGALFLHQTFRTSESAVLLRRYVREASWAARAEIPVVGTSFFNLDRKIADLLKWPAGHLLLLWPWAHRLLLYASFYGTQEAVMVVSSEPEHWQGKIEESGILYLISPGLRKFVGPKSLSTFLAHHMPSVPVVDFEIKALEDESAEVELPPFVI
jgi:hypothetical protein